LSQFATHFFSSTTPQRGAMISAHQNLTLATDKKADLATKRTFGSHTHSRKRKKMSDTSLLNSENGRKKQLCPNTLKPKQSKPPNSASKSKEAPQRRHHFLSKFNPEKKEPKKKSFSPFFAKK